MVSIHFSFSTNLKIEFKPGATNVVADPLSRAPLTSESSESVLLVEYSQTELHKEQQKYQDLANLIAYLESKSLPDDSGSAKKVLSQARKGYYICHG